MLNVCTIYSQLKEANMSKCRHFTISDSDMAIRDSIAQLQLKLEEKEGISLSQAKIILWAVKKSLRQMKK